MKENFQSGKAVEHAVEGAAIVYAGPELVDRGLEQFAPDYMVNVEGLPLEAKEVIVSASETIVPIVAVGALLYVGYKQFEKAIKSTKKTN